MGLATAALKTQSAISLPELRSRYVLVNRPSSSQMEEIYRLRVEAWRGQSRLSSGMTHWVDEVDAVARQWAIVHHGVVVGAIRMSLHESLAQLPSAEVYVGVLPSALPPPIASYNRLVVHPDHRGHGLSRVLDLVCLEAARAAGASALVGATGSVEANRRRIEAMKRLGFQELGLGHPVNTSAYEATRRPTVLAYYFNE